MGALGFLLVFSVVARGATLLSLVVSALWRRRIALGLLLAIATNLVGSLSVLGGQPLFLWAISWVPFFVYSAARVGTLASLRLAAADPQTARLAGGWLRHKAAAQSATFSLPYST